MIKIKWFVDDRYDEYGSFHDEYGTIHYGHECLIWTADSDGIFHSDLWDWLIKRLDVERLPEELVTQWIELQMSLSELDE